MLIILFQLLIFCTTFVFVWFLLYIIEYIMWTDWFEGRNSSWNIIYKKKGFYMSEKRFEVYDDGFSKYIEDTYQKISIIDNNLYDIYEMCDKLNEMEKENEQLKKDVEYWKQVASLYNNELNVFEQHSKKYKTECKDIHWSSD